MKKKLFSITSIFLLAVICFNLISCVKKVKAENLMDGVKATHVEDKRLDNEFIGAQTALSLELFKQVISVDGGKNTLISPLSISVALAMATNGANANTREQMQRVLGGNLPIESLNEYLYNYVNNNLPNGEKYKVKVANSIWLRNSKEFKVKQSFLQTNANYYGAQVYKTDFDNQTVRDINNWAYNNTDGMIEKLIEQIEKDTIAYIINALLFDAEWLSIYARNRVNDGEFTTSLGEKQKVKIMHSTEYEYLQTEHSTGLVKKYNQSKYAFVALLPNEGVTISEFVNEFSYGELAAICSGEARRTCTTIAQIPKFEYEYQIVLNQILKNMGMQDAFNPSFADFSNLGVIENDKGENIYINKVLHKTHISVAERGTKAGAITVIEMNKATSSGPDEEIKYVYLNRPFVYMIVDTHHYLPLFIGSVESIN
ncbi:MAG: serpin family protein [Clostridia bacterium]|nr:serpin family protein [Clostridia bacterium]